MKNMKIFLMILSILFFLYFFHGCQEASIPTGQKKSDHKVATEVQGSGCIEHPSGMLSWWPGDGNAEDIVNGYHGTLMNGATFTDGICNQAFHFDGVDDYVTVGPNPFSNADLANGATLEAWFRTSSPNHNQTVIDIEGWMLLMIGLDVHWPSDILYSDKIAVQPTVDTTLL
jgi:hypothetical protein